MQRCLNGPLTESTLEYLDDVIVFSPDFRTHLEHQGAVFEALEWCGLKLRPEKCQLFCRQVKFLGHCVSGEGVAPDPDKLTVVKEWPTPETVKQVRSFLGFAVYYRQFIRCFSHIAKPLNGLLVGRGRSKRQNLQKIDWTLECEAAFQQLKKELVQAPTLAYADFSLPFGVHRC